jgi:hypothetical protein
MEPRLIYWNKSGTETWIRFLFSRTEPEPDPGFFFVEPESKKLFQISLKNWNRRFFIRRKNRPTLVKANYGRMKRSGLKWIVQTTESG